MLSIWYRIAGVPVYLAPWTACPPGGKPTAVGLSPGGQAVPGYLTPHPGYLHPQGASCPGRFILPPAHTKKILLCDVYYYLQHYNNYMQFLSINMSIWMITSNIQLCFLLTKGGGQAVQGGLSCPPPRISKRKDNQQYLLHHLLQKYLVERDINFQSIWNAYFKHSVGLRIDKRWGGGQAVQGGLSCPPPRISGRMDNPQILLHHLLQEYLVERDINIISVNLRCLLQMFSWVTYWRGVGGKLSRVVYLAPI